MLYDHGETTAKPIAAMGYEWHERLSGKVVLGQECADDGRRGHSPDRKPEEYGFVRLKVAYRFTELRLISTFPFTLRLRDLGIVIVRVCFCWHDLKQRRVKSAGNLRGDQARVAGPGEVGHEHLGAR